MREYIESGIFLLPCPFCAAKEIKFSQLENDACQSWLEVGCEQCGAIFNESEMMPNEKTAFVLERLAKKWNTRNARELVQRYSRDTVVTALRGFAAQNNLNIQIAYTDDAVSHDDYKESPIFGRTRAANETEQGAIAALVSENGLSVFQTLNKALNARGYCLSIATVAARMPSKLRNSPDVVVHALRQFAAQNNLTIDIAFHVFQQQGRFQAHLLTTKISANGTSQSDRVDLLDNGFVGQVLFLSPYCRESDDDALLKTEYGLACQISAKKLLLSTFPRVELQVPDLLTCAIDSRELLA